MHGNINCFGDGWLKCIPKDNMNVIQMSDILVAARGLLKDPEPYQLRIVNEELKNILSTRPVVRKRIKNKKNANRNA